jgi:ribonuclease E
VAVSSAAAAPPVFVVADQADAHPAEALVAAPLVAAAPAVEVAVVVAAPAVVAAAAAAVVVAALAAAVAAQAVAVAAPAAVAVAVEEQVVAAPEAESAARYSAVAEVDRPQVRPDRTGRDVPRGARPARSSLAALWPAACPTVVEIPVARLPQAAAAEWQASDAALRMVARLSPAAPVAAAARRTGLLAPRAADRCPTVHVRSCQAAAAQ